MAVNYEYLYAQIEEDGMCVGIQDTTNYILNPLYVPIEIDDWNYVFKYYYPIPETVESFDDFQGQWYEDAEHTIPWNP